MMQNNEDLEVLNIVHDNYEKNKTKYVMDRIGSKKQKGAKHLKIQKRFFVTIALTIGILTVSTNSLARNIKQESKDTPSIVPTYAKIDNSQKKESKEEIVENKDDENVSDEKSQEAVVVESVEENDINENQYEKTEEEKLIKKYCDEVFGIKYDVAYEVASRLTNNFASEDYINSNNPAFTINKKQANNKEHGIILFLRHLYQKPQDFGLSKDDVINYDFSSYDHGNEEYKVKYYSDLFGVDKDLVLAIEYQEASSGAPYQSKAYLECNNPAGLMNPNNPNLIWKFQSPDAGIIEHIYQLKTYYLDQGYTTPEEIREKYAPSGADNDIYDLNKYWVDGVNTFLNKIKNNPDIYEYKNIDDERKQIL